MNDYWGIIDLIHIIFHKGWYNKNTDQLRNLCLIPTTWDCYTTSSIHYLIQQRMEERVRHCQKKASEELTWEVHIHFLHSLLPYLPHSLPLCSVLRQSFVCLCFRRGANCLQRGGLVVTRGLLVDLQWSVRDRIFKHLLVQLLQTVGCTVTLKGDVPLLWFYRRGKTQTFLYSSFSFE